MKIKIWTVISSNGDGSYSVDLFPTEELARENLDDDDFYIYDKGTEDECIDECPSEVSLQWFETDGCVVMQ